MPENRSVAEARAVWDFTIGEPDKLAMRLEDLRDTMRAFSRRGTKARFAMIVRGPASRLIVQRLPSSTPELGKAGARIASLLEEVAAEGVTVEQCGMALARQGVRREDLLPFVTVIENSFVSIVDYEQRGYAYVPIDR
ncbi:MAG: DsrE family protein [Betaproteobacteria bacterium]|nr:DsrE family protein [Betaproteobacteria bacterium]